MMVKPNTNSNESVSNPDTMIVNHTINGYTTDITETVMKVQSRVVSVLANVDERIITGSGVVYRSSENECYILASYTTIQNADVIEVRLDSGVKLPAEVVGVDEKTDIAYYSVGDSLRSLPFLFPGICRKREFHSGH